MHLENKPFTQLQEAFKSNRDLKVCQGITFTDDFKLSTVMRLLAAVKHLKGASLLKKSVRLEKTILTELPAVVP